MACVLPKPPPASNPPSPRDALEGKGPQRRPQKRLNMRSEEVANAVGGGYCRLQMPLKLALGVRGIVAGRRLRALGGGCLPPPFHCCICILGRACVECFVTCVRPYAGFGMSVGCLVSVLYESLFCVCDAATFSRHFVAGYPHTNDYASANATFRSVFEDLNVLKEAVAMYSTGVRDDLTYAVEQAGNRNWGGVCGSGGKGPCMSRGGVCGAQPAGNASRPCSVVSVALWLKGSPEQPQDMHRTRTVSDTPPGGLVLSCVCWGGGGGPGGWHDAMVGFSVCSRRRQLAHRHWRCPSLPFP